MPACCCALLVHTRLCCLELQEVEQTGPLFIHRPPWAPGQVLQGYDAVTASAPVWRVGGQQDNSALVTCVLVAYLVTPTMCLP
jgi:hypothetical protein